MTAVHSIGVGIVGAGLIGHKRLEACRGALEVRAVYDIDPARATSLAEKSATAVGVPSIEALVERDDIDLVVVATPHNQLAAIGHAAMTAGKHILIEKPGGVSAAELASLGDEASRLGLVARIGYNHRFHPALRRAREIVADDVHGRLLWIRARYGHGGRPGYEREWRADRATSGGGELIDQGSHLIDLVRFLIGDVELAFAELPTLFWDMSVEDNAFIALRPRCGGLAWLHASWSEWKNMFSMEITLERAKLEINGLGGSYGVEQLTLYEMAPEMGPPFSTTWRWPFSDASWTAEMDDVINELAGSPAIGASAADAQAVFRIIEAAYASVDSTKSASSPMGTPSD
jgi:predicted dehydrogenase